VKRPQEMCPNVDAPQKMNDGRARCRVEARKRCGGSLGWPQRTVCCLSFAPTHAPPWALGPAGPRCVSRHAPKSAWSRLHVTVGRHLLPKCTLLPPFQTRGWGRWVGSPPLCARRKHRRFPFLLRHGADPHPQRCPCVCVNAFLRRGFVSHEKRVSSFHKLSNHAVKITPNQPLDRRAARVRARGSSPRRRVRGRYGGVDQEAGGAGSARVLFTRVTENESDRK
jgi:hypothetical protein